MARGTSHVAFSVGPVNPTATSSLINTFVWGWAIEWTFFVVEIAAAMVHYYGWDRLKPSTHLAVGPGSRPPRRSRRNGA